MTTNLQDKLFDEAEEIFEIRGIGLIQYRDPAWIPIADQARKASAYWVEQFADPEDWTKLTAREASQADSVILELVNGTASSVLDAVKASLLGKPVADIEWIWVKVFLMQAYGRAARALELHLKGVFLEGIVMGVITEEQARVDLDTAVATLEMFAKMGEKGLFNSLINEYRASQGLSAADGGLVSGPLIAGVIVAVVVLVVALWWVYQNAKVQQRGLDNAEEICRQLPPELASKCAKNILESTPKPDPNAWAAALLNPLGIGLGVALVAYIGVKFVLPEVFSATDRRRSTSTTPALTLT